eukprot:CAMPEP_0116940178 /NCGR_PEP_ID=MMETSP0467-20121206/33209_1 /TAXON_ID=283647 /ORGANISM="Mesodinium pulex, Strain SPMC105" /LENGTH=59 /DNA_ID=CAMNT_0004622663 /DNA_START=600 /DNA_END=779 /DNA_ORIENTATION=+
MGSVLAERKVADANLQNDSEPEHGDLDKLETDGDRIAILDGPRQHRAMRSEMLTTLMAD